MKPFKFTELSAGAIAVASFALVVTLFAAFACERPQTRRVSDASQAQALTFSPTGILDSSGYIIRVRGRIDGTALVEVPDNDPETISGDVDWSVYHDFFEPPLVVEYRPSDVRSGELTFRVTFQ